MAKPILGGLQIATQGQFEIGAGERDASDQAWIEAPNSTGLGGKCPREGAKAGPEAPVVVPVAEIRLQGPSGAKGLAQTDATHQGLGIAEVPAVSGGGLAPVRLQFIPG